MTHASAQYSARICGSALRSLRWLLFRDLTRHRTQSQASFQRSTSGELCSPFIENRHRGISGCVPHQWVERQLNNVAASAIHFVIMSRRFPNSMTCQILAQCAQIRKVRVRPLCYESGKLTGAFWAGTSQINYPVNKWYATTWLIFNCVLKDIS